MKKKTRIKRKLKIIPVLILLVAIVLIYFLVKFLLNIKVQNIFVSGNHYLNDDYIIEKAGLENYPSYFANPSFIIKNRLVDDTFIKDVKITKKFFAVVNIEVEENNVLFYKENDNKYVLEDGKEVDSIPYKTNPITVVNYIPDTIYDKFVKKMAALDEEVREKISEVKYAPSEIDDSLFVLYMVDGNYVYINLSKFSSINYYNEIYPTLGGKKGVLYLDSGNHFQELK